MSLHRRMVVRRRSGVNDMVFHRAECEEGKTHHLNRRVYPQPQIAGLDEKEAALESMRQRSAKGEMRARREKGRAADRTR